MNEEAEPTQKHYIVQRMFAQQTPDHHTPIRGRSLAHQCQMVADQKMWCVLSLGRLLTVVPVQR